MPPCLRQTLWPQCLLLASQSSAYYSNKPLLRCEEADKAHPPCHTVPVGTGRISTLHHRFPQALGDPAGDTYYILSHADFLLLQAEAHRASLPTTRLLRHPGAAGKNPSAKKAATAAAFPAAPAQHQANPQHPSPSDSTSEAVQAAEAVPAVPSLQFAVAACDRECRQVFPTLWGVPQGDARAADSWFEEDARTGRAPASSQRRLLSPRVEHGQPRKRQQQHSEQQQGTSRRQEEQPGAASSPCFKLNERMLSIQSLPALPVTGQTRVETQADAAVAAAASRTAPSSPRRGQNRCSHMTVSTSVNSAAASLKTMEHLRRLRHSLSRVYPQLQQLPQQYGSLVLPECSAEQLMALKSPLAEAYISQATKCPSATQCHCCYSQPCRHPRGAANCGSVTSHQDTTPPPLPRCSCCQDRVAAGEILGHPEKAAKGGCPNSSSVGLLNVRGSSSRESIGTGLTDVMGSLFLLLPDVRDASPESFRNASYELLL